MPTLKVGLIWSPRIHIHKQCFQISHILMEIQISNNLEILNTICRLKMVILREYWNNHFSQKMHDKYPSWKIKIAYSILHTNVQMMIGRVLAIWWWYQPKVICLWQWHCFTQQSTLKWSNSIRDTVILFQIIK